MPLDHAPTPSHKYSPESEELETEATKETQAVLDQSNHDLSELGEEVQAGLEADDLALLEAAGISSELFSQEQKLVDSVKDDKNTGTDQKITSRFQKLIKTSSVANSLSTIRAEFGKKMDKKSRAVLSNFEALVSPTLLPDETEQKAVETLFISNFSGSFTQESFAEFVQDIYDQPDTVISEESKQKIERTFNIPRHPITTGRELSNSTQLMKEDGSFVHDSEKSALEFRPGVKTYMNPNGEAVLSLDGSSRPHPISIPPHMMEDGEYIAELANYALIRQTVYDEMGQLTNLFGGGTEDDLDNPDENTIDRANHFTCLLIGRKAPDSILTSDNLDDLRSALNALRDPSKIGEIASTTSLSDLGILNNGNLQWERIDTIGHVLRENQFYRTFEMKKSGEAHRLLTEEIQRKYRDENTSEPKMSAFSQKRTLRSSPVYGVFSSRKFSKISVRVKWVETAADENDLFASH